MKLKTKTNFCRKAACLILAGATCATFFAGQFTAFSSHTGSTAAENQPQLSDTSGVNGGNGYSLGFKNANGKVDLSGVKLSNLSDKVIANEGVTTKERHTVIVELNSTPVCDGGDIAAIQAQQTAFLRELSVKGIDYEYKCGYSNVLNGVAVTVPLNSVSEIKSIKGVSSLSLSTTYARPAEIEDDGLGQKNDSNIYPNGIYDSSEYTAKGIDGRGMTVAILDTGLDYTHPAFAEENMAYPDEGLSLADIEEVFNNYNLEAEIRSGSTAEDVYVSKKVPFAYDYSDYEPDVYPSYSQHGTHVAGIVAGKTKEDEHYTDKDGKETNNRFLGVAPEAQLVICKVFTDNLDSEDIGGARSEDIIAALDDCVALNVDVINMSLGTTAGFSSEALRLCEEEGVDTEGKNLNRVYESIRKKGISLMVAASNDYSAGYGSQFGTNLATNPDSGTVGSPSTFDGAMSVASINGQYSPYIVVNEEKADGTKVSNAIYYEESRNEDSDAYNFLDDMLRKVGTEGAVNEATFRYVVIPGYGSSTDYTPAIKAALEPKDEAKKEKVIAVIKRGGNGLTFKKKIQTAKNAGAEAVIVYNNVSGMIRMSLEDLDDRIPAISVSIDAGEYLTGSGFNRKSEGTVTLSRDFVAGPFMNDYSSWGSTPDLKLKPDVTAHGGEIISTVAGGYEEMSGTSMACPNLAGFTALLRGKLRDENSDLWLGSNDSESAVKLTNLTNNILMSTAVTVYDQNKLPYSPRKQGSGLATMKNAFGTKAYLSTDDPESGRKDGRPKAELGEDEKKNGVYDISFYVNNFSSTPLTFKPKSIFMTETLSKDGMSVAEKAHLLGEIPASWKVDGTAVEEGKDITVNAGITKIEVTLKLSEKEKGYLDDNFANGMFVEGFLQLISADKTAQCDLTLPYMGFYGDWEAAPLLDYDCFEIAKFDKDTSLSYEERPKASVWATQAYSYYWNNKYSTPLGNFLYLQDPAKEHTAEYVYTEEEHVSLSRFNEFYGDAATNNYCTVNGIRGLYAGLLRNAEIVTYTLTNVDTGEQIPDENGNLVREVYRLRKAHSSGGNAVPSQVEMEMKADEMNFDGNGKYRLDFNFYFKYADYKAGKPTDDTFTMSFYVDYEAPVLVDSRIRYQNLKDNGKDIQKVYLDLDIYDNHYPQAVLLCYTEEHVDDVTDIDSSGLTTRLATEYITPILNPKKNSTNTVSIDVTEFYEEYKDRLIVEIDDYAMNHNVYLIDSFNYAEGALIPDGWSVNDKLTVDKNGTAKVNINNIGKANASNYTWESSDESIVKVKNGEVFGVAEGTATVTVTGSKASVNGRNSESIEVTVRPSNKPLSTPKISFGAMLNEFLNPVKAEGTVNVNPGQQIPLSIEVDPWYYPVEDLDITWTSDDESLATVDQNGNVSVLYEDDDVKTVSITASCEAFPSCTTSVSLAIQDPFTVSNGTLTRYCGWGGVEVKDYEIAGQKLESVRVLTIPSDKSIISIGEEAFKDVETVEVVIIPKMVASIAQRAFKGCKNLKKICFVSDTQADVKSSLNMIYRNAFEGCPSLTTLDLTNCKVITLDIDAFAGCTGLKEVINMPAIGTAYDRAFMGCTSLKSADLTGLHLAGRAVFSGCTGLESISTGKFTAIGYNMFGSVEIDGKTIVPGCTSLKYDLATGDEGIVINCKDVPAGAFKGCSDLTKVTFTAEGVNIGDNAFYECTGLVTADVQNGATYVGDMAFGNCSSLNIEALKPQIAGAEMGYNVFRMRNVGEHKDGAKLVFAAQEITDANYLSVNGITEIGAYAFSTSSLNGISTLDLSGVTKIGEGAFYRLKGLTSIVIPDGITEIADYAFAETGITEIVIPASVTKIGAHAFDGCASLESLTFAQGCALDTIGAYAFYRTGVKDELNIPATVETIGDRAFAECNGITAVNLPSVKKMGEGVFMNCTRLATAVFGDETTVTGTYTFYAYNEENNLSVPSSLTSVKLGNGITEIDRGVFTFCRALTEIDLNKVTEIGDEAFAGCSALVTVKGIERVEVFGSYAFTEAAIPTLDLAAAKQIGYRAFCGDTDNGGEGKLTSVTLGSSLKSIGDEAFAGSQLKTVTIPASCTFIGTSAFSGKATINEVVRPTFNGYVIEEGNEVYFAEDGVLYQYIDGKDSGKYALIAYPDARAAQKVEGVATYTVKEGTISIGKFAFGSVIEDRVAKVVFPYTVKTIGHGAFFASGISTFEFESINAPTLLEDVLVADNGVALRPMEDNYSMNSYFYMNFFGYMSYSDELNNKYYYVPLYPGDERYKQVTNELTIRYPENGKGYDNLIYSHYFGDRVVLGEMIEDDTRTLISLLEGMADAKTVSGWNSSNTTKPEVEAFAATVKRAHAYKNALTPKQTTFVSEELLSKLTAVEAALKPVKKAFGIPVRIDTCAIVVGSEYKTAYKAGETFDMSGIRVKVTYDDYSEEIINASGNFTLSSNYNRPLRLTDNMVELTGTGEYAGARLSVRGLKVTEGSSENAQGGFPVWAIIVIAVGGAAVIAAAAVVAIILVKKSKAKSLNSETEDVALEELGAEETSAEEPATEDTATEETDEGKSDD